MANYEELVINHLSAELEVKVGKTEDFEGGKTPDEFITIEQNGEKLTAKSWSASPPEASALAFKADQAVDKLPEVDENIVKVEKISRDYLVEQINDKYGYQITFRLEVKNDK